MTVYENIRKVAKARGLSLQEVATKSGLSPNMIYQYKNVNPKMDTIRAIAKTLNVSVDYLLGNTDEMHSTKNTHDNVLDLREVSDDERYDMVSAGGRPITDEDWAVIKAILAKYPKNADED